MSDSPEVVFKRFKSLVGKWSGKTSDDRELGVT